MAWVTKTFETELDCIFDKLTEVDDAMRLKRVIARTLACKEELQGNRFSHREPLSGLVVNMKSLCPVKLPTGNHTVVIFYVIGPEDSVFTSIKCFA